MRIDYFGLVKGAAKKLTMNTLPDDLLCRCLARVPLADRVTAERVCKGWYEAFASRAYTVARRACAEPAWLVMGGKSESTELSVNNVLDVSLRKVAELAPRHSYCAGSAAIPGLGVLVLEGSAGNRPTATAWVYDLQAGSTWRHWADLPTPCYRPLPCALGESIYVDGCVRNGNPVAQSELLRYDKHGNLLETIQKPDAIRRPFVDTPVWCAINGLLFVLTQVDDQDSICRLDSYNPATGEWRRMPDPPIQALGLKAAVLAGKLYVMGGMVWSDTPGARPGDVDRIADVQVFDGQEWSVGPPLPSREAFEYAVSVGDSILAITNVMSSNRAFVLCNGAWRREQFPYFTFFADCAVAGGHSA